ncbi:hypothetical protein [Kaistella palustris]|uniref:hypothetical protein n=1 Tax=Kaistella palustris TaxID=493376 RepID=UPI0003FD8EB0|nr:hypothetical protein [Kaistella palustris]
MKTLEKAGIFKFLILLLTLVMICCTDRTANEGSPFQVRTIVSGKVYDYQRNIPVPDYLVTVQRSYRDFCGYMGCTKTEDIASVKTDRNGNYTIPFNYILDTAKENYSYCISAENSDGYIAEPVSNLNLIAGAENIRDVNAWKPIKVNFNLNITDCTSPPVIVSTLLNSESGTFNSITVQNNGASAVQLLAKPSSDMLIRFYYFEGGNYSLTHVLEKQFITTNDEEQVFSFDVDCSQF